MGPRKWSSDPSPSKQILTLVCGETPAIYAPGLRAWTMDIWYRFVPVEATDPWAFCRIQNPAIRILIKAMTRIFSCLFWRILGHRGSKESKFTYYLFMWLLLRFQGSFLLLASFASAVGSTKRPPLFPEFCFSLESLPRASAAALFFPPAIFTLSRKGEFTSVDKC